jgi:hypothetical protein
MEIKIKNHKIINNLKNPHVNKNPCERGRKFYFKK